MGVEVLNKRALVLEDAVSPQQLSAVVSEVVEAEGPLNAAKSLAEHPPDLLIANARVAWQRSLVSGLHSKRAAVLLVGAPDGVDPATADEWVMPDASVEELASRVGTALFRAKERKRSARRQFVDPLTGLPNRRALVAALVRDCSRARRTGGAVCLVLLDLDEFKQINETMGHPEGDRVLRRVGAALRHVVREDEVCGRIGGDEFAFVVSGRRDEAEALIDRVQAALRECGVSASAAACQLGHAERLRDLYRRTDELLSVRKQQSRANRAHHADGSAGGEPGLRGGYQAAPLI